MVLLLLFCFSAAKLQKTIDICNKYRKKYRKILHMSKKSSTFAADFEKSDLFIVGSVQNCRDGGIGRHEGL